MAPDGLSDLDPFDLFDAEARRLDRRFESLDDGAWRLPSRCEGWSVRDVLGHLAGEELYNHACLDDALPDLFARLAREGAPSDFNGFNEWCVRQRRGLPVTEVLAEWRFASEQTRRRMRERGRHGTLQTSVGPYPVGLQTFHLASEFATHADDIEVPVEAGEEPARTEWRGRVGQFVLSEQDRPVEVEATPEGYLVRMDGVSAVLSGHDFVAATVARLPYDHPLDPQLRTVLACLA